MGADDFGVANSFLSTGYRVPAGYGALADCFALTGYFMGVADFAIDG